MPKYRLLTPGPVAVPERVLHAMARTLLHHRAPAFIPVFKEVRANLKSLISDMEVLVKAAIEGRLETRADANKHSGDYRRIVDGVNKTLDAVIQPLNVAANYVDRISKGDLPPKITQNYNGDFNAIKDNLNLLIDAMNQVAGAAERIAQMILARYEAVEWLEGDLADSARGAGGFGSSGR